MRICLSARYLYLEGSRVYFNQEKLEYFVLDYDYRNPSFYEVPWTGVSFDDAGIAEMTLDSIIIDGGDVGLLLLADFLISKVAMVVAKRWRCCPQ